MGNYNGWRTYGVSRGGPSDPTSATALTTSFQVFACTKDSNHGGSSNFPNHGILMGVEVELKEARRVIQIYRKTNGAITQLWTDANNIYVCLKTSATAAKVKHIRVNWRA